MKLTEGACIVEVAKLMEYAESKEGPPMKIIGTHCIT
jgi:hypothetical protein